MDIKNKVFIYIVIVFINLVIPSRVRAEVGVVTGSAQLRYEAKQFSIDTRVVALSNYLKSKNSPISHYSALFIEEADRNNIDWRLVPSISGVESSFGKRIPKSSYNAYGWANGAYKFRSWDHSIGIVSQTLNDKYYKRGATNISKIAKRYAPPSSTWAGKVKYFMNKIDSIPVRFDL